jgi:putative transposase
LPRRWVDERTVARIGRHRRMSKGDECLPAASEARIHMNMARLLLKRGRQAFAYCL